MGEKQKFSHAAGLFPESLAKISPWYCFSSFGDLIVKVAAGCCCTCSLGRSAHWVQSIEAMGAAMGTAAPPVTWSGPPPDQDSLVLLAAVQESRNQPQTLGHEQAVGLQMGRHGADSWGGKHSLCKCTWLKDEGFSLSQQPWESCMHREGGLVQRPQPLGTWWATTASPPCYCWPVGVGRHEPHRQKTIFFLNKCRNICLRLRSRLLIKLPQGTLWFFA